MLLKKYWRLWAKSLGEKESDKDDEADLVAVFRTTIVVVNFITCIFICVNVVKHW